MKHSVACILLCGRRHYFCCLNRETRRAAMINTNKCSFNKQSINYCLVLSTFWSNIYDVFWCIVLCFDVLIITNKNSKFLLSVIPIFQSTLGKTNCHEKSGNLNIVKLQWHPSRFTSNYQKFKKLSHSRNKDTTVHLHLLERDEFDCELLDGIQALSTVACQCWLMRRIPC